MLLSLSTTNKWIVSDEDDQEEVASFDTREQALEYIIRRTTMNNHVLDYYMYHLAKASTLGLIQTVEFLQKQIMDYSYHQ